MSNKSKYQKELNTIRQRRIIFWLVLLSYMPCMIMGSKTIEFFYPNDPQVVEEFIPFLFFFFAFIWILVTANSATSLCPKCDERFCHRSNTTCQQCHNCGLELRSDIKNDFRRKYGHLIPLMVVVFLLVGIIALSYFSV